MKTRCIYFALIMLLTGNCMAQSLGNGQALLEPSGTQYFQNQYLGNSAMAGIDSGLHLNAAYRKQWSGMEGAPVTKFFTADYAMGNRVGLGVNIFNDEAGLINRTRAALTYAYHLPLSHDGKTLHLGLSLAMNLQRLDYKLVDGEINDPSIGAFNRRDDYFEGEFGMAYTHKGLTLQAALPNIRSLVSGENKGVNGGGIFFSAAAYKFSMEEGTISSVEPKLCYRGIRGYDNILDIGVNVAFLKNVANLMAVYHTSNSFTAGIGVNIMKTVMIQAMYTVQTGGVKTYADGTYEIGATVNLFK